MSKTDSNDKKTDDRRIVTDGGVDATPSGEVGQENDLWQNIPDFDSTEEAVTAAVNAAPNGVSIEGVDDA